MEAKGAKLCRQLLESERDYNLDLKHFQAFRTTLRAQRILPDDDIERLFYNLDDIVKANGIFLAALEEVDAKEDIPTLERGWGMAFFKHVSEFLDNSEPGNSDMTSTISICRKNCLGSMLSFQGMSCERRWSLIRYELPV